MLCVLKVNTIPSGPSNGYIVITTSFTLSRGDGSLSIGLGLPRPSVGTRTTERP